MFGTLINSLSIMIGRIIGLIFKKGYVDFSKWFVTSALMFWVGAMAIAASQEAKTQDNYEALFAIYILEDIPAIVYDTKMGRCYFLAVTISIY